MYIYIFRLVKEQQNALQRWTTLNSKQDNVFWWVEEDKTASRVVHPSKINLKIENSTTIYIFRLIIEQPVDYVYPSCKSWTTLSSMQDNLFRGVKIDKSTSRVANPSEVIYKVKNIHRYW